MKDRVLVLFAGIILENDDGDKVGVKIFLASTPFRFYNSSKTLAKESR